jgi:hypothetical protein
MASERSFFCSNVRTSSSPGTAALFLLDFFVVDAFFEEAAFAGLLDEEAAGVGCWRAFFGGFSFFCCFRAEIVPRMASICFSISAIPSVTSVRIKNQNREGARRIRTVLVIVLTVVILDVHIIIVRGLGFGPRQVLPLFVEQSLQIDASQVHGRTGRVEVKTVANHEFEVSEERLSIGILVVV